MKITDFIMSVGSGFVGGWLMGLAVRAVELKAWTIQQGMLQSGELTVSIFIGFLLGGFLVWGSLAVMKEGEISK